MEKAPCEKLARKEESLDLTGQLGLVKVVLESGNLGEGLMKLSVVPSSMDMIQRRKFLTLSAATLAAAQLGLPMPALAKPTQGGHFRIAMSTGSTHDTLDPATYIGTYASVIFWGTWSNSLCEIDADGNAVPDLAESMEVSEDLKTWRFRLREGVQFHDGTPVTPADVIASINHHRAEDSKSVVKNLINTVMKIEADGDRDIVFTLSEGNIDFHYSMADSRMPIMPSKDGVAIFDTVRTGAFVLKDFEPGVRMTFERNPNYHKPVYFDSVEALVIPDASARMNALMTNAVDYADNVDLKTIHLLERNQDVQILENPGYGYYGFEVDVTIPPFDNPLVRKALKLSIDREEIFKKIFSSHGLIGNDTPIAPAMKYSAELDDVHNYDPEEAKRLLAEAGHESISIDLSASDAAFPGAVNAATLWQAKAAACNIHINVIREASDSYWDVVWGKKPLLASYWGGRPTVDSQFSTFFAADAPYNATMKWKNSHFNDLLVQGRAEQDPEKRAAIYREMQELIHDEGGLVNILFFSLISAHSKKLNHGKVGVDRGGDSGRICERWWFEA